ncbi:MAG: flavodoxin family protein [Thermoleophilia bacterium]|nr:flavodoxin family protein [Thermoleophilia bacterium]
MKILAISCSPRSNGNTVAMLREVLAACKEAGAEVELYSVAGKDIQPCEGCWSCAETGRCRKDDETAALLEKMLAADGIVFGVPVYFHGMTAQAKAIIDRTISLNTPERSLTNKVMGVVASAGSLGLVQVLKDFTYYAHVKHMLPANHVAAYPSMQGGIEKMPRCRQELRDLGRQMVALADMGFRYPPEYIKGPNTFGTHTM